MFKTRVLATLALTAALSLLSVAEASAAGQRRPAGARFDLVARVEAGIASFWGSLTSIWGEVGPRMDDNG